MTTLNVNLSNTHKKSNLRYCGRTFSISDMELIRSLIAVKPRRNRHQRSKVVCVQLDWHSPNGQLKDMSCCVAMLRMHRDSVI